MIRFAPPGTKTFQIYICFTNVWLWVSIIFKLLFILGITFEVLNQIWLLIFIYFLTEVINFFMTWIYLFIIYDFKVVGFLILFLGL